MTMELFTPTGRPAVNNRWPRIIHLALFVLFLASAAAWGTRLLNLEFAQEWRWTEATCLLLATASTVVALARRLPAQNVLLACGLIALMGGAVQTLGAATGIPFGAHTYTDSAGWRVFDILPWPMPLMWVVVILNARGVARLILRPWRMSKTYGFRVIGLTCVLAVAFDFALEPFASQVNRFWIWQMPTAVPAWHTAPWSNFLGWLTTSLLILAFVTPGLINKKPVRHPPDYHPLDVWLVLNLIFAAGTATHGLWLATGFTLVVSAIAALFAVRGAKW
jgi:uncharacterized membrane protein